MFSVITAISFGLYFKRTFTYIKYTTRDIVSHIQLWVHSNDYIRKFQSNLERAALPPLTAENNYAMKSLLVTKGCPTFTPKTAPSPSMIDLQPSNTHFPWPTLLTIRNGIQIQSAVFPQFTHQTKRQTDELGGNSVWTPAYTLLHTDCIAIWLIFIIFLAENISFCYVI